MNINTTHNLAAIRLPIRYEYVHALQAQWQIQRSTQQPMITVSPEPTTALIVDGKQECGMARRGCGCSTPFK